MYYCTIHIHDARVQSKYRRRRHVICYEALKQLFILINTLVKSARSLAYG